ncbi:beta-fructofuranosidase [Sphingobacterium allocomposti]|uniref:beta-fructofuranosidase n=1 Tax=Sphingobacterium allocomposti TaxID=415956 RepID=A0A5S5DJY9_9SPHI|nr:glycoside hydrolase family 32 protein [Sphingobacterium composti Yoo et al. 2007 non Ten et al. 2007]TYP96221.1 beta-fructofuranosidase [Sphingobacterium composti Yoo et al. 2007 non Ten et al. 2007]
MKAMIGLFPFLFYVHLLTGCKNNEIPAPTDPEPDPTVDMSITCSNKQEAGGYQLFYKPQQGFVGDPMPYFNADDNRFYLFYLYENANHHPIYLTRSADFASFEGFTEIIPSGAIGSQEEWIGTGSFIKKDNTYYSFYTGHNAHLNPAEKVMMATSSDMLNWTKQPGAAFQAPGGYDQNNFRDPHVYWDETRNSYVMLVTTRKDGKGTLARFTSPDLSNWSLIEPLVATTSDHPGKHEIETDSEILECPDIFKMDNQWYLTFSRVNRDEHRKTFYRISDSPDGPWRICRDADGHHETFDGLYLYAGKTASNGTTRYLSGWCSTGQTVNSNNELHWSGSLISHKLIKQPSGKLYPAIPDAVDAKFNTEVAFAQIKSEGNVSNDANTFTISTSSSNRSYVLFNRNREPVKISMKIDASQSERFGFSFGACDDLSEVYSVSFDLTSSNRWGMPSLFMHQENRNAVTKKELNFTPLVVPANRVFDIKIVIENSVCVVYVNNNVAFTNRIYKMNENPWAIFSDHGTIRISGMAVIKS